MATGSSATSQRSVQEAKKQLRKLIKVLDTRPTQILEEEANRLKAEIIAETPYKTGKLERSVQVSVAKDKKRPGINASASALNSEGYNYAGIQHEDMNFKHPIKGKDHFISDPFERAIKRIIRRLTDEITGELRLP